MEQTLEECRNVESAFVVADEMIEGDDRNTESGDCTQHVATLSVKTSGALPISIEGHAVRGACRLQHPSFR